MSLRVPPLQTDRLLIRDFVLDDLDILSDVLHRAWRKAPGTETAEREATRTWLEWSVLNYPALAELTQPPYGERAITLRESGRLIGAVGYVPCLGPFDQLVDIEGPGETPPESLFASAFGLYWAVDPIHQGRGYATEAAQRLIDYAFQRLRIGRMVAATEYTNTASQGVMRKLGMRLMRNAYADPPWFQVVGVLDNPRGWTLDTSIVHSH